MRTGLAHRLRTGLRTFTAPVFALSAGCTPGGNSTSANVNLVFNTGDTPTPIVVTDAPIFLAEPVFDRVPGKIGSHAPTLASFADGELLAAWYSYAGPGELDEASIYAARQSPGLDGWQPPELLIERREAVGNPVLYSEGNDVWLFYAVVPGEWSTSRVEVRRSADRGHTWSPPRALVGPLGTNVRYPPVRTLAGDWLLPAYDDLLQRSLFFASADGETWDLRSVIATDWLHPNVQPSVTALADGRLLAVMRNAGRGWLWVTTSDDDGQSWTAPGDSGFPNPASPAALLRLADGHLALVYNDSAVDRQPLSLTVSGDEGRTWHTPRVLVEGAGEYAYPALLQTPDGLLHVVYSHDRERIVHLVVNEAWAAGGV
jgi:predicted neuraminidase